MDSSIDRDILNLLEASSIPQAAKDLVKHLNVYTKSQINTCLYRLQKSGQVVMEEATSPPRWKIHENSDSAIKLTKDILQALDECPMTLNDLMTRFRGSSAIANINGILVSLEHSKQIKKNKTLWMRSSERDRLIDSIMLKLLNQSIESLQKLDANLN